MAIIPGKQKVNFSFVSAQAQKQKKMIWVLLILIVAIGVVYYMYVQNVPIIPSVPVANEPLAGDDLSSKIIELIGPVSLDIPLINDKNFQLLILPGDLPIVPGEKGRVNPFEPF
jgi:hypothetical protein